MDRRRLMALFGLAAVAVVLALLVPPFVSAEALLANEERLRLAVQQRPIASVLIAFCVYVGLTLIPGLAGKSMVFGWLLGFARGLVVVNLGLTVSAMLMFLVGRHLIRDIVTSRWRWLSLQLDRAVEANGTSFLIGIRLVHAPFTVSNYALGTTKVSPARFWCATQVGLLPGNIAFVLAGASIPSLRQLQEQGMSTFVNVPLLAGLTLIAALPLVAKAWVNRRRRRHAPSGGDGVTHDNESETDDAA